MGDPARLARRWSLGAVVWICLAAGLSMAVPSWGNEAPAFSLQYGEHDPALLRLDSPLPPVLDMLGSPDTTAPDLNATTAYTWYPDGGGELTVVVDHEVPPVIVGMFASQPPGSTPTMALSGGATLGQTTPAEILAEWGEDGAVVGGEGTDYLIAYTRCRGPFPVVVKFGQPSTTVLDGPVSSVLVAYADEEPGSAGCALRGR